MFDLTKTSHLITLILLFPFGLFRSSQLPEVALEEGAVEADRCIPLQVMTFNLRYASAKPPNSWPERRPVVRELIEAQAPDVIGTQEGLHGQLRDMAADLPEYDWIGQGRDGGNRGEFMAIFYRRDRLEPVAFDHFWLSRSPEVPGSRSWANLLPRMVSWAKLRDRKSGECFYFFNTHLDHLSSWSRDKSAELILDRVRSLDPEVPVLLVGDFNAAASGSTVHTRLVHANGFRDAWIQSKERGEAFGTFHNYAGLMPGRRIDWILVRGAVAVDYSEMITFAKHGQYPSDHLPVISHLRLAARRRLSPDAPERPVAAAWNRENAAAREYNSE